MRNSIGKCLRDGMQITLLSLAILVVGVRYREERYSCHVCRELKNVGMTTFWGCPIRRGETQVRPGQPGPSHEHPWWRYSTYTRDGLGGWLGEGAACSSSMYRDGKRF